ncbi:site-specific integrase [Pedobacter sp. UC225_65]|uniref:site-specific integrase n=1 Tax=Pedobacter sp. UC225_65 TaxID=3350173 RepID=UPI003671D8AB
MSKVTLRQRTLSSGRITFFLDFYPPLRNPASGRPMRKEYLKLYMVQDPKSEADKMFNKQTLVLAENIRAKRQMAIQNNDYGFLDKERLTGNFMDFYREIVRKKGGMNCDTWFMSQRYLASFSGEDLRFFHLTVGFCEDYKEYLLSAPAINSRKKKISNNTALKYYNMFRYVLRSAYKHQMLTENIYDKTTAIREHDTHREFLTIEEFQKLATTDASSPMMKKAGIVSGLTGLRFSDIKGLKWSEIRGSAGDYYIQFTQKKTKGAEVLPISDQTYVLLGKRRELDNRVFPGLNYNQTRMFLPGWLKRAGITKHITFHSFRHTYATLQLSMGTDIFTVSKLLGHKDIKTTQIYTKIIDSKKKEAATRIHLEL